MLSRNENPNVDQVNMGAFFSFRHVCTCGIVTLTCFFIAIPNSTYCDTVLSITFLVVLVYLRSWYHMKGNTEGFSVIISMCYFNQPKN